VVMDVRIPPNCGDVKREPRVRGALVI